MKKKILLSLGAAAAVAAGVGVFSAFETHIINVTVHICQPSETRSIGFWKNHPEYYENCLTLSLGARTEDTVLSNEADVAYFLLLLMPVRIWKIC